MTTDPVQLTFDGREVPHPLPKPRAMTERQRQLWLWGAFTPENEFTTADAGRFFADPNGALRRLETFGRVRRLGRGRWRAI
jgi:hypothetical protein